MDENLIWNYFFVWREREKKFMANWRKKKIIVQKSM